MSLFLSPANRGVLQSLIEKHFPAPDRKKLYSLLGIDLTAPSNNSSPRDSPCKENKIKKRKGGCFSLNGMESSINFSILKQLYFGNELPPLNWQAVAYFHCHVVFNVQVTPCFKLGLGQFEWC